MPRRRDAILRITDGTTEIDVLGPGSGFHMEEPNWDPQIADLKGGGTFVNPAMAEGRTLVHGLAATVVENIPLSVRSFSQPAAIRTLRGALKLLLQAENYWKEPWEYDDVWLEVRLACSDNLTGYSRIIRGRIPNLTDPFGQPFFSPRPEAIMAGLSLVVEREPYWRATPPGSIIGPLYNLIKNPDFELWNVAPGIADTEPDSWNNIETLWITGANSRQASLCKFGNNCLKIRVSGSTKAGAAKGLSQVVLGTESAATYTALAWVRSEGISNGVGRILITYSGQLELFRSADRQGWSLASATFTTGTNDIVAINCEILTTAANTDGTIYIDGLMIVPGNWLVEARNGTLPWMSSSHVVNHWDQPRSAQVGAGDINWVDGWNVPGDVDSLIRLEIRNNTPPGDPTDPTEVFSRIRIGQRRTKNVLNFDNYHDPPGVADTDASGGDRVNSPALDSTWLDVSTRALVNNVVDNLGRYRVLARVYDTRPQGSPNLDARLRYFIGVAGVAEKTLDSVPLLVRGAWTLIDLTPTAAMVQEAKFASDTPAQLGYTIQLKRDVGTETGRLDYILAMPTDGGFLDAEKIDPPLSFGNMLLIDNTASQTIAATLRRGGFSTVFRTGQIPQALGVYKNALYIGCEAGEFYRFQNNIGLLKADYGANTIQALEVYNGLLHLSHGADLLTTDAISFSQTPIATAVNTITALKTFNGLLFIAISGSSAPIYTWDTSSLTLSFTTNQTSVDALEVYHNRLYAGTSTNARVYQFNPADNTWNISFSPAGADATGIQTLKTFDGKLYAGTTPNGKLYAFDGSAWTEVEDFSTINTVQAMTVLNGVLYAAGTPSASLQATTDGTTWAAAYDPEAFVINAMIIYDGALFVAENTIKDIMAITFTDVQYKVPRFRGNAFTAPHTRRHRWVFSYNRENIRNEITDAALIGIGFVPRYLSLRGNG